MRIVIETSEDVEAGRVEPAREVAQGAADSAVSDGGAGPAAATTGSGRDGQPAGDVGPPPDWLLDAVGAAEAAGVQVPLAPASDIDGALASDAGAGPAADPVRHVTTQEHPT